MKDPATPQPLTEAPTVSVADGYVLLDHPTGVALTLTAEVAAETGARLVEAAAEASGQQQGPEARDAADPDQG